MKTKRKILNWVLFIGTMIGLIVSLTHWAGWLLIICGAGLVFSILDETGGYEF